MSVFKNNTYITDLEVGDKVVEHHKYSGLRYVSTVSDVTNDIITVTRKNGRIVRYNRNSATIISKSIVPAFVLLPYVSASDPTPFNPGPVAGDAETL